jgi:polynucleotide 5'-hydroxyl-kinase GRC3/NOL9
MFSRILTPDTVLLVKGPMKVDIHNEASILGKDVSDSTMICGKGKVWPIETKFSCEVVLLPLGEKQNDAGEFWICNRQEVGTKIWEDIIHMVFRDTAAKSILLLGPTDSGKTTLSTYIINQAIKKGFRPAIIDADIGQGDLAPPSAIGCAVVENQILDLREVNSKYFRFVGSINPTRNERLISLSVQSLLREMDAKNGDFHGVDLVVINTDGYVTGDGLHCKIAIANLVQPETIICLGENAPEFCQQIGSRLWSEKTPLLLSAKSSQAIRPLIKLRAERGRRRIEQFQRYLADFGRGGTTRSFSLRKTKFIYKGLVYYRALVTASDRVILLRKNRTRTIANASFANRFVGLGRASTVMGFGIISSIDRQRIAIHTNLADLDTIYLSNISISMQTWKPYTIKDYRKTRYFDSRAQYLRRDQINRQ